MLLRLKNLSDKATAESIANRVHELLDGQVRVSEIKLWRGYQENDQLAEVRVVGPQISASEAVERLRGGRFHRKYLTAELAEDADILSSINSGAQQGFRVRHYVIRAADRQQTHVDNDGCQRMDEDDEDAAHDCALQDVSNVFEPNNNGQRLFNTGFTFQRTDRAIHKGFVTVVDDPSDDLGIHVNGELFLAFIIMTTDPSTRLYDIKLVGTGQSAFSVATQLPIEIDRSETCHILFRPKNIGIYKCVVQFTFKTDSDALFEIVRFISLKAGDARLGEMLKPVQQFQKRRKAQGLEKGPFVNHIIEAPRPQYNGGGGGGPNPFHKINYYFVPHAVKEAIDFGKLHERLQGLGLTFSTYKEFYERLLWAQEDNEREEMKFFDMDQVDLRTDGEFVILKVPGLAEGRPSLLTGDIVELSRRGKTFKGRVSIVKQTETLLSLDRAFGFMFQFGIDKVDVTFSIARTNYRICHYGLEQATRRMGPMMLFPTDEHVQACRMLNRPRIVPEHVDFRNKSLNEEQQAAVQHILRGECRPMPYLLFGPPGTGKTTTIAEAIFQLARHASRPNILLVAPSNDAADILIEKLSPFFSTGDMRRILAKNRALDLHQPVVHKYADDTWDSPDRLVFAVKAVQIVVSTVNFAARLEIYGIKRGHFEVMCVDEAGHATEPEVVALAASLLNFHQTNNRVGQLILSGDPRQLGPTISSELCKHFGLGMSYMERLALLDVYGGRGNVRPSGLITKLVRNYRSHPAILKLPNEIHYHSELTASGDMRKTHNLVNWRYLPTRGFPILFHGIHGECVRELSSPSWFSPLEAEQVVTYVEKLVRESAVPESDIGIITPYSRQALKIRQALVLRNFTKDIKVGSVETFQGQERRCIIVSTVRAESQWIEGGAKSQLGFVADEKRFNVAVTRAAALLIVIGHPGVLATDTKNWLPFLRYCKENGGWAGADWEDNVPMNAAAFDEMAVEPREETGTVEQIAGGFGIDREGTCETGTEPREETDTMEQLAGGFIIDREGESEI